MSRTAESSPDKMRAARDRVLDSARRSALQPPDESASRTSTPASLRARKMQRQREDLLDAAAALFRAQGYEATRMEDIAVRAEVSTKTVYNYFPTKQRILVGLLDRDRARLRADYERVLEQPPDDPAEALALLIRADVGDVRTAGDKRLWRELLAAATQGHDRANDEFDANRRTFTRHIEQLLGHYVQAGALPASLPLAVAVDLVYAVNAFEFREYCAVAAATPSGMLKRARRQMRLIVDGWRAAIPLRGRGPTAATARATRKPSRIRDAHHR